MAVPIEISDVLDFMGAGSALICSAFAGVAITVAAFFKMREPVSQVEDSHDSEPEHVCWVCGGPCSDEVRPDVQGDYLCSWCEDEYNREADEEEARLARGS